MKSIKFLFIFLFFVTSVQGQDLYIENGRKVTISYVAHVDNMIMDSTEKSGPLSFVQGSHKTFLAFENQVKGMRVGEKKDFILKPEEAFGKVNPANFHEFSKKLFKNPENLTIGTAVQLTEKNGHKIIGIVWENRENSLVINFNHQLAGKTIYYEVKILAIE